MKEQFLSDELKKTNLEAVKVDPFVEGSDDGVE
jgi:hypothetical protein